MKGIIDVEALSTSERIRLAQRILDSALEQQEPGPLTKEQLVEVRRRFAEVDSGKTKCKPWEEIYSRLHGRA